MNHLLELGIHFQHPCPHIHSQNGRIERKHQHIVNTGLTLLAQANLPLKFWWEAFNTAVLLINYMPSLTLAQHSPYYLMHNKHPDYKHLKVFGCSCFPYLRPYHKHKLELRSHKCVFIGYSPNHKGFKCLSPTGRLYIADSVVFNEFEFPYSALFTSPQKSSTSPSSPVIFPGPIFSISTAAIAPSTEHSDSSHTTTNNSSSLPSAAATPTSTASQTNDPTPSSSHLPSSQVTSIPMTSIPVSIPVSTSVNKHSMITRTKSGAIQPKALLTLPKFSSTTPSSHTKTASTSDTTQSLHLPNSHPSYTVLPSSSNHNTDSSSLTTNTAKSPLPTVPRTYKLALQNDAWHHTMALEDAALKQKATWLLVPPSPDQKLISNKWVFRVKTKADGSLDKLKARLVARGFEQLAGVDFHETFSPVVKFTTLRFMFALAATRGWEIQQLDVNNSFLNGDLEETIYMTQPKGFEDPEHPHYVCKLLKSIYGLKQAPRAWYEKLKKCLLQLGFQRSTSDFSLFYKTTDGALLLILVYVDDILITGDSQPQILEIIKLLNASFALKHPGKVHYFLGIEVSQAHGTYSLNQSQYILELLDKNDLADCNSCATPMTTALKLSKGQGSPLTNPTPYRSTVGALQYLTLTRPDIAFTVNKLSQFLQQPTDTHWMACKHLLRYLKGTHNLALHFTPSSSLSFSGFADADWASCPDDRRSTGGHCVYFGTNLIAWASKKQPVVSRSSAESEYRSLANAAAELLWLHSLCSELGVRYTAPSKLWSDNKSALALASNPVFHARTKHVEIDVHFIREQVQSKTIEVGFVPSEDQVADLLTKSLPEADFIKLRHHLRLRS